MKLLNKNFLFLVGSQLFSVFGTAIAQFAISLYVLDKTGSMGIFSIVLSLSMVSRVLFLPFGGIVADRLKKRKLMIAMDFSYLIMTIGLSIGVVLENSILVLGIISILLGVVSSLETPVVQSAIPLVCKSEDIPQANGIINSIAMLSNLLAPVLASVIYNFQKAYIVFIVSSICFLFAVICEILLKIEQENIKNINGKIMKIVYLDTKETITYLKENVIIAKIGSITFLLNLFISSFINVVIPFTARVVWEVSDESFGVMNMMFSVGGLGGSILVSVLAKKISGRDISKMLVLNSFIFLSLIFAYIGIFDKNISFWIVTIITSILLGVFTMISVQLISYIQMVTNNEILGRVMSFIMMISMLAMPVGQLFFGSLQKFTSGGEIAVIIGAISLISIIISVFSNKIFNNVNLKDDILE
ncbi:MFS transporter [Miniphocaeibacter massiliensis]|uniref:MFS transporter n=1 Tax=Miniphocaeibacter massiliensis TaxID=2041841 RepID=UPI000C1BEB72|nr:MFS transporter [Miniphocaeibacter massiliensis]